MPAIVVVLGDLRLGRLEPVGDAAEQRRELLAVGGRQLLDGGPDLPALARRRLRKEAPGCIGEREVGDPPVPRARPALEEAPPDQPVDQGGGGRGGDAQVLGKLAAARRVVTQEVEDPELAQGQPEVTEAPQVERLNAGQELDQRCQGSLGAVGGLVPRCGWALHTGDCTQMAHLLSRAN